MTQWSVVLKSVNSDGVVYDELKFCDDLTDVARVLLTFKPKRGYTMVDAKITIFETLV